MRKIESNLAETRKGAVEREFQDYLCDEVGLSPNEVVCRVRVTRKRSISGIQNKQPVLIHVNAEVINQGNRAVGDVSFVTGEPGAKEYAKTILSSHIFKLLNSQEYDLRALAV